MDRQGRVLIANFGIYDREAGPLQRFDPATGAHETLLAEVDGRRLTSANYPVMTGDGCIWCANSTHAETWPQALDGRPDGFLFVLRPDGSASIVAEGLKFPNGLTLSADEETLLCAQTTGPDVLAFPILPGGRLGPGERYGPVLGLLQEPGKPAPDANDLGYTDGVGLDAEGNVWVCLPAANKVVAITPSKAVVTLIHDPSGEVVNHPTNVTWGGDDLKDLYIGSIRAGYVLKARSPIAAAGDATSSPTSPNQGFPRLTAITKLDGEAEGRRPVGHPPKSNDPGRTLCASTSNSTLTANGSTRSS